MYKSGSKRGLAFAGWLLLSGGASADAPFPFLHENPTRYVLSYGLNLKEWVSVEVLPKKTAWPILVRYLNRASGVEVGCELNELLLPDKGHLDEGAPVLRSFRAEADGFVITVDYSAAQRTERYTLGFAHVDDLNAQVRGNLRLVSYRHERIQMNAEVSGLVLDYRTGWVRWLGGNVAPLKVAVPAPLFEALPNIFDFSPDLGLRKVN